VFEEEEVRTRNEEEEDQVKLPKSQSSCKDRYTCASFSCRSALHRCCPLWVWELLRNQENHGAETEVRWGMKYAAAW
jgi:hypothetical protein